MYQVFVVEDESLIRQSIRDAIEGMQGPYAFCGEASDGEMALSMMQDLMPDILLTDVRMPFLDGFGLIRHARAMMPWLKVVIISGYGDFDFTQKAISLGVDQYLLKPVRQADLVRVIEEMAAQIEKSKAAKNALPTGLDEEEVLGALRQQFMQRLLYGSAGTAELLEKASTLKLDIVRSHYLVCVLSFDAPCEDQAALRSAVQRALEGMDALSYCFNTADQMTLLAFDNDPEALSERVYRLIGILRHELNDVCPVITAVVSRDVVRLSAVSEAYKTACGLLKTVSGFAAGQVVSVGDTAQFTADLVRFSTPFGEDFQRKLLYAEAGNVPQLLDEALSAAGPNKFDSLFVRYNALIALMRLSIHLIARNDPDADETEIAARMNAEFDLLTAAADRQAARRAAENMLMQALSAHRKGAESVKFNPAVSLAEKYLRENFCDPNISLISAARHVGMSPAHFSTVFSQTTGRSFISSLTALRIGKAKELLRGTNMRLADIAMEIGYNEPNYFSHVFRKLEGITPKEYRSRRAQQEDAE